MGRIPRLRHAPGAAKVVLVAVFLAALCPWRAAAEETLAARREEFQHQLDPVRRAKYFPKLGNALLAEMRKQIQAEEFAQVPPLLVEYRDDANAAFAGLETVTRDADKHPAGYRELEMHLRQSLHVVNDIVFALPLEDRGAVLAPQRDIEQLDQRLVKALFPARPEGAKTPPSASQSHPQG